MDGKIVANSEGSTMMKVGIMACFLLILISFPSDSVADNVFGDAVSKRSLVSDRFRYSQFDAAVLPQKYYGDNLCPCLSKEQLANMGYAPTNRSDYNLDPDVDPETFGINCGLHHISTSECKTADGCINTIPVPRDCDRSWCSRAWCYVDPANCSLFSRKSPHFAEVHYSYATCGYMDSFTYAARIGALEGKVLDVALNSNTGGWKGAKNARGSFTVNQRWTGPILEFVKDAAFEAQFTLNITRPPEWLQKESLVFFGSSSFDYCVYTAALGYVDLCIAAYTITDKRAAVTDFFEFSQDPIYLIAFNDNGKTGFASFLDSFLTIFRPFAPSSWCYIALVFMPLLGLIMVYHEYGEPGSPYPTKIPVLVTYKSGRKEIVRKDVPWYKYIVKAIYMSYLAFALNSYEPAVMTVGGKVHLLAIQSFVLMTIAVYTANLAAILTQAAAASTVSSIKDAITAGYVFCAERKIAQTVQALHNIDPSRFVVDPIDLGGDGDPGFNCAQCNSRNRVFDFMKLGAKQGDALHCNAAIAVQEDLQVLQALGEHCNKTVIGEVLAFSATGIPLSSSYSEELTSLFYDLKYEGRLDSVMNNARPQNVCPPVVSDGTSLTVEQLTGVWVMTLFFSIVGIITSVISKGRIREKQKSNGTTERKLERYDQWGAAVTNVTIDGMTFDNDSYKKEKDLHVLNSSSSLPSMTFNLSSHLETVQESTGEEPEQSIEFK